MIDWERYTGVHSHPLETDRVEIVGYERKAGGWDVYVYEPVGSCPELEASRVDDWHIFIETIDSSTELERVAAEINRRLGSGYELAVYFRESGGRIYDYLRGRGAQHMWVRAIPNSSDWELVIRRKDFELAGEVEKSNMARYKQWLSDRRHYPDGRMTHEQRMRMVDLALHGLSVGDAFWGGFLRATGNHERENLAMLAAQCPVPRQFTCAGHKAGRLERRTLSGANARSVNWTAPGF
jgi:hypothetical protein